MWGCALRADGYDSNMRKIVQKRIRRSGKGVNVVADVNAVVATSTGGATSAGKRQSISIVQRNGRTEVTEK
jgi:high-affinity K+ transport system ATPase subunit B